MQNLKPLLLSILFSAASNFLLSQTTCTNCNPCVIGGGPCCNVWNACNYGQSFCYDNTGCPASTVDPGTGCDLACTPIDSGVLFLLLGGATLGGMLTFRRKQETLQIVQN